MYLEDHRRGSRTIGVVRKCTEEVCTQIVGERSFLGLRSLSGTTRVHLTGLPGPFAFICVMAILWRAWFIWVVVIVMIDIDDDRTRNDPLMNLLIIRVI